MKLADRQAKLDAHKWEMSQKAGNHPAPGNRHGNSGGAVTKHGFHTCKRRCNGGADPLSLAV